LKSNVQELVIGRNFEDIRISAGLMITMEETLKELEYKIAEQEEKKDTPYRRYLGGQLPNLYDTPEGIANKICEYVAIGIDHFILRFNFNEEIKKMRLFMDKVKNRI
jgi:alkanesulfonate monooxygenase SsuD/methylene tetrahydromethanopterin reductase-like flavin-dependent oxidoreductase (luciferase family)